jgi:hypothetical protein
LNRMSRESLTRRRFLTLPLALLLAPGSRAFGEGDGRRTTYAADASLLYGALRYRVAGNIDERVDRATGRYEVRMEGQGTSFSNGAEASGVMRAGRWAPLQGRSWVKVAGREGRAEVAYDYDRQVVQYRSRSETFFLGRVRVIDDLLPLPAGVHIDDTMSALLNHADGLWRPTPAGTLETHVVRRRREPREGVEETGGIQHAEIVPVTLKLEADQSGVTRTASFDLTHFSTWALPDRPAQVVFGPDRRPQQVSSRLMFGTSLTIRFQPG